MTVIEYIDLELAEAEMMQSSEEPEMHHIVGQLPGSSRYILAMSLVTNTLVVWDLYTRRSVRVVETSKNAQVMVHVLQIYNKTDTYYNSNSGFANCPNHLV